MYEDEMTLMDIMNDDEEMDPFVFHVEKEKMIARMESVLAYVERKEVKMENTVRESFKLIVAGSRGFNSYPYMAKKLDVILSKKCLTHDIIIVSGTATGADRLGEQYAKEKGYEMVQFPADWDRFGKSAGYKRNARMADYADACVVFWDGSSKGAKHMIDLATEKGLILQVVRYNISPPPAAIPPVVAPVVAPVAVVASVAVVAPVSKTPLLVYTDGSYNKDTAEYGMAFVVTRVDPLTKEETIVYGFSKMGNNPKYAVSHNVAGEVGAAVYALAWAAKNSQPIIIRHDYEGLGKWYRKEWKSKKVVAHIWKEAIVKNGKWIAGMEWVKGHSGNKFNEVVDEMASKALAK